MAFHNPLPTKNRWATSQMPTLVLGNDDNWVMPFEIGSVPLASAIPNASLEALLIRPPPLLLVPCVPTLRVIAPRDDAARQLACDSRSDVSPPVRGCVVLNFRKEQLH